MSCFTAACLAVIQQQQTFYHHKQRTDVTLAQRQKICSQSSTVVENGRVVILSSVNSLNDDV